MKSILICLCLGLQRGKTGHYAESNGGGKGKSVTPSLQKEVSPPYTVLRKRLLCISGVSRELISGNPDSPTFLYIGELHTGEPSLKILVPAASLRGQRWVQHSTPDTVRHGRGPSLGLWQENRFQTRSEASEDKLMLFICGV